MDPDFRRALQVVVLSPRVRKVAGEPRIFNEQTLNLAAAGDVLI